MSHILKCHDIVKTNFVRAENCFLYDELGRKYTDFESGIWCTALGHSHPRISQVIASQAAKLMHLGTRYPNTIVEEAALAVLEIVQIEAGKCTFLSSSSEAVEFGTQTIRRVTGKNQLLTFSNSYLAAYAPPGRKIPQIGTFSIGAPVRNRLWSKSLSRKSVGLSLSRVEASGFVRFPPKQLVEELAQRIRQAGGLVMANEVTAGMGRTGKWFGFQHYDLQPDIVALGKGLGNGYPVSAVALSQAVAEKLEASGLRYAQSHQNDPLGCAVAQEVITIMREGHWVEKGAALGAYFLAGLQGLVEKHAIMKEARGRGMLLGLEFHPHDSFSAEMAYHALLERGFLTGYYPAGNLLRFDPALTMEQESIDQLLDGLNKILQTV